MCVRVYVCLCVRPHMGMCVHMRVFVRVRCVRAQALGVSSSQDRGLLKKKIKELKVLQDKTRRNREKLERQRDKLRQREQEQQRQSQDEP